MTTAPEILGTLHNLKSIAVAELDAIEDANGIEAWRITYLGRKEGLITMIMKGMAALDTESKRTVGAMANDVKALLESQLEARIEEMKSAQFNQASVAGRLDVTLPGRRPALGRLHPITQTLREITSAFGTMGFQVVEGPEVETDHYNFEMLNIPKGHPARDMFDTLWLDHTNADGEQDMLLRTHTSPVQIRVMEEQEPPIYSIMPGRVFRSDTADATHMPVFHQIEGLVVDRGITFGDMAGTMDAFTKAYFGREFTSRLRPSYFPFTEPSAEFDILRDDGSWLELAGCGMVHPNVLQAGGLDPEIWSGFAFGFGLDRLALMRHGIDDLRELFRNDHRFLSQF